MPDGNQYYILEDTEGYRHMLPYKFYSKFGFELNQEILCQVVKVNCNGKLFLEPRHPFYSRDEYFNFLIIKTIECENCPGVQFHVIKDKLGNEYNIAARGSIPLGTYTLNCKVKRINKGRLELEPARGPVELISWPRPGTEVTMTVLDHEPMASGESYYILGNESFQFIFAEFRHYQNFGWKRNDEVVCHVFGMQRGKDVIIEPEHPVYKLDQHYTFKFVKLYNQSDLLLGPKRFLIVEDTDGQQFEVMVNGMMIPDEYHPDEVICRVRKYRKGQPVLSLAQSIHE